MASLDLAAASVHLVLPGSRSPSGSLSSMASASNNSQGSAMAKQRANRAPYSDMRLKTDPNLESVGGLVTNPGSGGGSRGAAKDS
eukprot:14731607-Alexandrium_andersonii.AAC.1